MNDKKRWHDRIPGYRSKKIWKMITASFIYGFIILMLLPSSYEEEDENLQPANETSAEVQEETKEEASDNNKTDNEEETDTKEYAIGDAVKVGKFEYVINDIETTDTVGPEYMRETTAEAFLVANVSVTNNANEAEYIDYDYFKLFNGDTEYSVSSDATITANDEMEGEASFVFDEANPGSTLTGNVVFEVVPEVAESDDLQLRVEAGDFATTTELISLK